MRILVLTIVFPNEKQPTLGTFVRERVCAMAGFCDVKVLAPVPWFPLIASIKKNYRPIVPRREAQRGLDVFHPKFFSIPGLFKILDGFFLFLSCLTTVFKIKRTFEFDAIDAHFAYPDGFAAVLLAKLLRKPVVITMRGTEIKYANYFWRRMALRYALRGADQVRAVSDSLKKKAIELGIPEEKITVIPNGVDIKRFKPGDRIEARHALNLPLDKSIILSVGGLVERKGYHRIIKVLPQLLKKKPNLLYIVVGGPSVEGDFGPTLQRLVRDLALEPFVQLVGAKPAEEIPVWMNAADVFCLATSNEGWSNVFFEALACGKPVVTTNVGGNPEVIKSSEYGILVDVNDSAQLARALYEALDKPWDSHRLVAYARENTWERVGERVFKEFVALRQARS